jgi:Telomere capping, CST complex subunit
VDITLILESVKSEMLQPGTWLNIIGYRFNEAPPRRVRVLRSESAEGNTQMGSVQAVLVWSAGALRIADYEKILLQQYETGKRIQTMA